MPIKDKQKRREAHARYMAKPGVREKRNAAIAAWCANNAEHRAAKEATRRLVKRAQCLIASARTRARKKGLIFGLDDFEADLQRRIDAGFCEITGVPFDLSPGRKFNSPSLDRINPSDGYVPENIRVVCHAMNAAMGDWGDLPVWQMFVSWLVKSNAICPQTAAAFIRAYLETQQGEMRAAA